MAEGDIKAEFNSAIIFLNRLEALFNLCVEARMSANGFLWGEAISSLFLELSNYMKDTDRVNKLVVLRDLKNFLNSGGVKKGIKCDIYWSIFDFELWLRSVKKDAGLEMKMSDDASKVMFKGGF